MTHLIIIPDDFPRVISGTKAEEKARLLGEVRIHSDKAETEGELTRRIKESEVVINIRAYTRLTRTVLCSCPSLRLVSVWGTGTDNVDLETARELGITVTNTPGANALSVAEHTMAILFSLARQIPYLDGQVRSGKWPRGEMVQLSGKVLGLLGLGAVGKHTARMAKGLGMDVRAWTLHPTPERAREAGVTFVSKEELLKNSDVISLHLRLSNETKGFLRREDFDLMKRTAFFVNTSRAGLVAPGELFEALHDKKIAGAALDVYDEEPLPSGDPLTTLPNVVLTPHNAGLTPEAALQGLLMAVENVESFLIGREISPERRVVKGSR